MLQSRPIACCERPCWQATLTPRQLPKVWMEDKVLAAREDFPTLLSGEEAELMAAAMLRHAAGGGRAGQNLLT